MAISNTSTTVILIQVMDIRLTTEGATTLQTIYNYDNIFRSLGSRHTQAVTLLINPVRMSANFHSPCLLLPYLLEHDEDLLTYHFAWE